MTTARLAASLALLLTATHCSHGMKTGGSGGTSGATGGATGGFLNTGGATGGSLDTGGATGGFLDTGGVGSAGTPSGSGGCWWMNTPDPNMGGAAGTVADHWPASPVRTPGTAVARSRVDAWTAMSSTGAPTGPRTGATAVWTGNEMIVWGGLTVRPEATGGRYDPALDQWKAVSTSVAPSGRQGHVAVWTGTEMIVWGGSDGTTGLRSGGRYDPVADHWTPTSIAGAITSDANPSAVWTGTEMLVWFGQPVSGVSGVRYDPSTDTWKTISTVGAPKQQGSTVVWTGTEMIVWGGLYDWGAYCVSADGAIYNPATDTWRPMTGTGAPHPRSNHSAVWTGTAMIVWGGNVGGGSSGTTTAGSYDPVADAWYAVSEVDAPAPRQTPALFFVPDPSPLGAGRMLLWGGDGFSGGYVAATGAIYDFVPDVWDVVAPFPIALATPNPSSTRTTVWTGSEMIAWDVAAGLGARYKP